MSVKLIEGVFREGKVVVAIKEDADQLAKGGYGTSCEGEDAITLASYESLYLLSEGKMSVVDAESEEAFDLKSLLEKLRALDSDAWTKYLIYRDLRSRGYVVREGVGWGINFRVYERGSYGEKAAKFIVLAVIEGASMPVDRIRETLNMAQNMKKELIVAVMDRRGEIVYYSLSQLDLRRG